MVAVFLPMISYKFSANYAKVIVAYVGTILLTIAVKNVLFVAELKRGII